MRIVCCCCGKQAIRGDVSQYDEYCTTLTGAKAGFKSDDVFCGYCAKDLDKNGLFPEEQALAYSMEDYEY